MKVWTALLFGFAVTTAAEASPPPSGSEEAQLMTPHFRWLRDQKGKLGMCCDMGDGRFVEVRTRGEHYEVRFLHPETILIDNPPADGAYYEVNERAVLHPNTNPIGRAIAWWSGHEIYINGLSVGHIRCFVPEELY